MIRYRDIKDLKLLFTCSSLLRLRRHITSRESQELSRLFFGMVYPTHSSRLKKIQEHLSSSDDSTSDVSPEPEVSATDTNQFSYFLDLSGFEKLKIDDNPTQSDLRSLHKAQYDKFSIVANVDFIETTDPSLAGVNFSIEEVDGEGGILAFVSRPRSLAKTKVERTGYVLDSAHSCNMTDLGNIFLHEDGHVLSLDHGPLYSVMASHYVFNTPEWQLDSWTINQVTQIHGVRRQAKKAA